MFKLLHNTLCLLKIEIVVNILKSISHFLKIKLISFQKIEVKEIFYLC